MENAVQLKLSKEDFKFSAAHFLIFDANHAEKLHGHNYQVRVRIGLKPNLDQGLWMDFSVYKKVIRQMMADWDESVLLPGRNKEFVFSENGASLEVSFRERRYVFPKDEVNLLETVNTSVEELSRLLTEKFEGLVGKDMPFQFIEFEVEETRGQAASYIKSF